MTTNPTRSAFELALHFAAGHNCSKSIEYLRAAAKVASCRHSGAEAAALLTEALNFASRLPTGSRTKNQLEILNDLGAAYFMCGDFDDCSRAWHEAATKAIRGEYIDIAVQVMSRLAFPVGWSNPARLSSLADKVMTQIDKIDDACKRAEVTIQALGLRDISGVWKADDSSSAAAALREIMKGGDRVQIASAQIISARLLSRCSEYEDAILKLEESLPVVMEHDVMDVARAEWATLVGFASRGKVGTNAVGRDLGRSARRQEWQ